MSETSCPRCGYQTLNFVNDILLCTGDGCGYEHAVTKTMPIIIVPAPAPPEDLPEPPD
jgi:hypothetical protein